MKTVILTGLAFYNLTRAIAIHSDQLPNQCRVTDAARTRRPGGFCAWRYPGFNRRPQGPGL